MPRKRVNGFVSSTIFWMFFSISREFWMSFQRQNPHDIAMKSIIFLNYQIENQKSDRQKSVSDCSERSCLNIQSNWGVLCCEKNFHLIWMSILLLKWIHPGSTAIVLTPTVILIYIEVKTNFSCTDSFRFQLWRGEIQKL